MFFFNMDMASPDRGDFCHLLISFATSLDPYQAKQNLGPDLHQNVWHSDGIPEIFFQ